MDLATQTFFQRVQEETGVSCAKLEELWRKEHAPSGSCSSSTSSEESGGPKTLTYLDIAKLTKVNLAKLCQERALPRSGKKQELVDRLLAYGKQPAVAKATTKAARKPKALTKKKRVEQQDQTSQALVDKLFGLLTVEESTLRVKRNEFGNYYDPETRFVFDPRTHEAYGTQTEDGRVVELTRADVEMCKQQNIAHTVPNFLAETAGAEEEEVIEGLDEEDTVVDDEEDEEGSDVPNLEDMAGLTDEEDAEAEAEPLYEEE